MKMKLTDAALKRYKPKTARDEIFDKDVKGFGVRVTTAGKAFFFVRRVRGDKVRFSLGQYPSTSLADARKQAFDIVDKITKGGDPRPDYNVRKRAEAEPDTFAHIANRFIEEYAKGKKTPLRDRTIEGYRWTLQGDLTAKWTARPIAEITDRDVIRVIDRMEADKHFASARRFRAHLSKFFNWAVSKRLIDRNPAQKVPLASTPADFRRDRVLKVAELQAVLEAANGLGEPWRAYVSMLILSGQRRSETAKMTRADLTLEGDRPIWRIPAEHTKNRQPHEVPIAPETAELLLRMPRTGDYVFSANSKTPIVGFSKMKATLDKALAGTNLKPWRLHDLRRSTATGIAELGFAPHVVEMVLNHVSGEKAGVSGLYNRSRYEADCRRALAAWAKAVMAKEVEATVVQLRA